MTRFMSRTAAAAVALVAGVISYGHIRQVALAAGESDLAASLLPIGIDGLIIVATLAMLEDSRAGRIPRLSARFALGFGVLATIAFNVGSAEPTWSARAVAAVPAASFLLAVEVLSRVGRPRPAVDTATGSLSTDQTTEQPGSEPVTSGNAVRSTQAARKPAGRARQGSKRVSTAERVAKAAAKAPEATSAELAARLRLSERTVQRYRPAAVDNPTAAAVPPLTTANGDGTHEADEAEVTTS